MSRILPSRLFSSLVGGDAVAAFLEKRRIYATRWGDGSEDMSTESDAVADDEHVCVFVLYRTSAGLSEASIYPNSSHFVEY